MFVSNSAVMSTDPSSTATSEKEKQQSLNEQSQVTEDENSVRNKLWCIRIDFK